MPLYNVEVTMKCTMVVEADGVDGAYDVAHSYRKDGFSDAEPNVLTIVTGEVKKEEDLRDGWDAVCIPYGGDGNTRIGELLKAQGERNAAT